jgi:uncharacterized membrane protein YfcA
MNFVYHATSDPYRINDCLVYNLARSWLRRPNLLRAQACSQADYLFYLCFSEAQLSQDIFIFIAIGIAAGILAGLFGVGGGIIIVPLLMLIFGFSQQAASGTSLVALLGPVGLLGVMAYFNAGRLTPEQIRMGLIIAVGMFFGTLLGAQLSISLPTLYVKRAFCIFLLFVAIRIWIDAPKTQ